jgi:signal transduction histidine kinase
MGVSGIRVRAVSAALAVAALVACVAGGALLASAQPYLSLVEVWAMPLTGAAYAGVAAYLAGSRSATAQVRALLVASVALAAAALSSGLAQRSGLWVAIGSLAGLAVSAVAQVCVVTLRGENPGRLVARLVRGAGLTVLAAGAVRTLVYDPAAWDWCRCATNSLAVPSTPGRFQTLVPWLAAAHLVAVGLAVVGVGLSFWGRPGRRGWPEWLLVTGFLVSAGAWAADDVDTWRGTPSNDLALLLPPGLLVVLAVHVVGLARLRPSRAHVADLLLAGRERGNPAGLRELVARAIGDPSAAVYWWDPDSSSYIDHRGDAATFGDGMSATRVLDVESDHGPIARVVTERPLVDDPGIREPVAEALRLATENRILQEELAESLIQVRESRSRIVQASDEARRRIERDLHDGAQQLLISTGAKLNLASTRVDPDQDQELAAALAEASDELGRALTELRSLARGITPTALVHGSLPDALEDLALRCPVPTTLRVEGSAEVNPDVASTLYFVVAECLANISKHAHARSALVELGLGDPARVRVQDDGGGGADPSGSGLRGLADRVEALGGTVDILTSSDGTRVEAAVPARAGGAG